MSHLLPQRTLAFIAIATIGFCCIHQNLQAEEATPPSLHAQIDSLLQASQFGPVAEKIDDATFARRVYLDLIGRIPTITETKPFLAEPNPQKRQVLVDRLLASPDFARHMAVTFDVMMMERRGGKHVKSDEFRTYLEQSFRDGKSYLQLSQEILAADGTEEKKRPAAAFYLERDMEPNLLTREIGRVFFGVDLQCAQCHNHPNIDDYHQEDYYGLQAFVVRASLFQPDKKKPALIAEKAEGEATFQSVFTDRASMTGPRVMEGDEVVEAALKPGERYHVAPAKNVRHIAKYSRIAKLSAAVTTNPTKAFDRNIANRLWAHMLGRGIVHPVDLHHSGNPPSNPELLELITNQFATGKYDVKSFLREIALSETYQRSAQLPVAMPSVDESKKQLAALEATSKEQLKLSYAADEQVDAATEKLDAAFAVVKPLRTAIDAANKAVTAALKVRDAAKVKVDARKKEIAGKQVKVKLIADANEKIKQASEAIKEDKELAATAATILKKLAAYNAEVVKSQTAEKGEVATLTTAEAKLKTTQTATDSAIAAAQPAEEKVRTLRSEMINQRGIAAKHRKAAAMATQKATELTALVEYQELQQVIETLTKQIPTIEQSHLAAKTAMPTFEKAVADSQATTTAAQAAMTLAQQIVQKSDAGLTEQRKTKALLAESLAKLQEAAKRLEGENSLAAAQDEVSKSIATKDGEIAKLETQRNTEKADFDVKAKAVVTATGNLETAQANLTEHTKLITSLGAQLSSARTQLEQSRKSQTSTWATIIEQSSARLNAAEVVSLTPEQLGWSVLMATGQRVRQRTAEAAKLNKAKPLSEEDKKDAAKVTAREQEIDAATYASLRNNVTRFVQLFGAGKGQPQTEFFATAEQALFFSNGGELRSWLSPSGGNLTGRLNKMEDPIALANELYLSVFCRTPTEIEIKDVTNYLTQRKDAKVAAVQELAWSLITSAEFRFQY